MITAPTTGPYTESAKLISHSIRSKNIIIQPVLRLSNYSIQNNKLRGFSPPAKYTDLATAACRRN
jgi:hypothetical protein